MQCRRVRAKRELVRVVRTPAGPVLIDERGKAPGRGAYLCKRVQCFEQAIQHGQLNRALKTELSAEDANRILEYGRGLPPVQDEEQENEG